MAVERWNDPDPFTFEGEPVTSARLVEIWTRADERFGGVEGRTDRIQKAQRFRQGQLKVQLDPDFLKDHPEVDPTWAVSVLPERESYERDVITKAGAIEPTISREPLDVTDKAQEEAEDYENYMRDVAVDDERGVPYQTFIEKFTEDGEGGLVVLPWDLDSEGTPSFYDRITEFALKQLDADQRKSYHKDENDRLGRYVKKDEQGNRVYNAAYTRDRHGRTKDAAEKKDGEGTFRRDHGQSTKAHEDAVRRYLLAHQASTFRFISAQDCYPLLGRGTGRQRWAVEGLIERAAFSREALVAKNYGWAQLGNRLIVPRGVKRADSYYGNHLFLYTLYIICRDEDMIERPCIFYSVGGASTWWDGMPADGDGSARKVAMIDLYDERKLRGRRWHYDFGLHTASDDPNWYGRPAIWPLVKPILNIEASETAGNVVTAINSYSGHIYKPDADLLKADPEAVIERTTHTLRRPKRPKPGGMEAYAGEVIPFVNAQIGPDHWRTLAEKKQVLAEAMAIDTIKGDSGNAMLVSSSQGQIAKRHIREAALRCFKFCLEKDAENRLAAFKCHEVKWPILTSRERPVGNEVRSRYESVEFQPEWLGEDENPRLNVAYGEEFNLAKVDLEINAYLKGAGTLKRVAAAMGEDNLQNFVVEIQKDRRRNSPEYQKYLDGLVDQIRQNKTIQEIQKLQAAQKLTAQGVPGAPHGIPTDILSRLNGATAPPGGPPGAPDASGGPPPPPGPGGPPPPGPGGPGGTLTGGPSLASSARGGVEQGALGADRAAANVPAALAGVA